MQGGGADSNIRVDTPIWAENGTAYPETLDALPARAKYVVIGAGYAGLSAGRILARAGHDVVIVDGCAALGEGASGRNNGVYSGGFGLYRGLFGDRFKTRNGMPACTRHDLIEDANRSVTSLTAMIAEEGIDCPSRAAGRLVGAATDAQLASLRMQCEVWQQHYGDAISLVGADVIEAESGSTCYQGGLLVNPSWLLEPIRLLQGLACAVVRHGARIVTGCQIRAIEPRGDSFACIADGAEIIADRVIVATNGLGAQLVPAAPSWTRPIISCSFATDKLAPEVAATILPRGRTGSDVQPSFSYFRKTAQGDRLVFGGRMPWPDCVAADWPQVLEARMRAIFPQLADSRIAMAWNSIITETEDQLPHAGELNGVFYCVGCNGSGLAMMVHLGEQTARAAMGIAPEKPGFWSLATPEATPAAAGVAADAKSLMAALRQRKA